ncbi:MAG: universal stress protein [Chloroflexi bacterium]|nr:universal stress protein [Chloroflexota bacterium]
MVNRILVPLDGSVTAERALPYAAELAAATAGRLFLVRALEPRLRSREEPARIAAYLEAATTRLAAMGVEASPTIADGHAPEAIVREIRQLRANLVVMAAHPHSVLHDLVASHVARDVVAAGCAPVLLVDPATCCQPSVAPRLRGSRVVVPLDGTEFAESALPLAVELALSLEATLCLIETIDVPAVPLSGGLMAPETIDLWYVWDPTVALRAGREYLSGIERRLCAADPALRLTSSVQIGSVAEHIAAVLGLTGCPTSAGVGMVVMATHARAGLSRVLLGETADEVFRHDHLPLALVHPVGGFGASVAA